MGFFGLPSSSEEIQPFSGDLKYSSATLPNLYLKTILDTFQDPDPNDLYDLSTVPRPTGDGCIFFNTIHTKTIVPNSPFLHSKAAAIVTAIICTETQPLVLPPDENVEPCEAMIALVHAFLNRLNEDQYRDASIAAVLMDTSHNLRLAAVGYKMNCGKVIMSFSCLDIQDIEDMKSSQAHSIHCRLQMELQHIFSSITVEGVHQHPRRSPFAFVLQRTVIAKLLPREKEIQSPRPASDQNSVGEGKTTLMRSAFETFIPKMYLDGVNMETHFRKDSRAFFRGSMHCAICIVIPIS